MSHIQAIGFDAPDEDSFRKLVMGLIHGRGEPYYYDSDNCYFCLGDESGAQIWLFISGNKEILGFSPHFKGDARYPVNLTVLESKEGSMQGGWQAELYAETPAEKEALSFLFECPDTLTFVPPILPWFTNLQLSAFAHELTFWTDEKAYRDQRSSGTDGLLQFSPLLQEGAGEAQPLGQFIGKVISAEERTNSFTRQSFFWASVETQGGVIDLVWHKNICSELPVAGSIVQAVAWLSGRIVDRPRLKGRGLKGLLFGRKS
jgi:hypothetical protein